MIEILVKLKCLYYQLLKKKWSITSKCMADILFN